MSCWTPWRVRPVAAWRWPCSPSSSTGSTSPASSRDITVPSLFVASDDRGDWTPEDAEAAAAVVTGARTVTIGAARTLIPLEQPQLMAEHVTRFWDQLA